MKNLAKQIILIGFICIIICGCKSHEPQIFGMPQSQWITLTPVQQEQAIQNYNEHHK